MLQACPRQWVAIKFIFVHSTREGQNKTQLVKCHEMLSTGVVMPQSTPQSGCVLNFQHVQSCLMWWQWVSARKWAPLESISWTADNTEQPAQCLTRVKLFLLSHVSWSAKWRQLNSPAEWEGWGKKGMWKSNKQNLLNTVNSKSEKNYWWVIHTLWWIQNFPKVFSFSVLPAQPRAIFLQNI